MSTDCAVLLTGPDQHDCDLYDLPLTTTPAAAAQFRDAQARLLRVQVGAEAPLLRAVADDPDFAVGHATIALLSRDFDLDVDVAAHLRTALRTASRATVRERSFVAAVSARVRGAHDHQPRLLRHIAEHPRDALALNIAVPTIAFGGAVQVPEQAWALVESARPAFGSDPWYAGLLAFIRQEQGRFDEAGRLAGGALDADPAAGHAAHAMAHVFYETGQHQDGLRWLDGWIAGNRRTAFHPSHYSWHAALHELSMGDAAAVRRRYDRELAPGAVQGVRALVDSASLLWRARLAGSWPDALPIDAVLSVVDEELLVRPHSPFMAMHVAVARAAQGDATALRLLGRHAVLDDRPVYRELVALLAAAMAALVDGRADRAAELLLQLMPQVDRFGGSKAQREVIEQTMLVALVEAGRLDAAQNLVQHRLDRPGSRPAQR